MTDTHGARGVGATWGRSTFGDHRSRESLDFMISPLAEFMDEFLAEYLRVNESACSPC